MPKRVTNKTATWRDFSVDRKIYTTRDTFKLAPEGQPGSWCKLTDEQAEQLQALIDADAKREDGGVMQDVFEISDIEDEEGEEPQDEPEEGGEDNPK